MVGRGGTGDPRGLADTVKRLIEECAELGAVGHRSLQGHPANHHAAGIEPQFRSVQVHQRSYQQARTHQQHDREGDFDDDQRAAKPHRTLTRGVARSLSEEDAQVQPRGGQRRRSAEEDPRPHRGTQCHREDAPVDVRGLAGEEVGRHVL